MDNKISILFYSKTAKKTKENLIPIYLRLTINGKRIEQSINRMIELTKWSSEAGKMKGTSAGARIFNIYLDSVRNKVYMVEREMVQDGKPISYETFKEKWLGSNDKPKMLMEIFQQHNNQIKELAGKEFSPATVQRYETSKLHTESFMQWKYKVNDIDITKLKLRIYQ